METGSTFYTSLSPQKELVAAFKLGTLPACPYFSYVIVNRRRPASAAQPMREFAC
jgi:hypothetical protein